MRCTPPAVSLLSTSIPVCMFSVSFLSVKLKSAARGAESKPEMKMAFGLTDGSGIVPYGLCLKAAQSPLFIRISVIFCAGAVRKSGVSNLRYSISGVASIVTASSFRFAPLTISLIFPLTGEQSCISGRFLSCSMGVPAFTSAPSLTRSPG